jgi:hypothetical protein
MKDTEMRNKCDTCYFQKRVVNREVYVCRRYPPQLWQGISDFPRPDGKGCGEWKRADNE